jgi:hypothetical protein
MHETKVLQRQFLGAAAAGVAGTQFAVLGASSAQAADPLS